jgi:hypothetical protein
MRRILLAFLAGFVSTVVFHQSVAFLIRHRAWNLKPVPPFGVPSFVSLAFWGGVWGIVLILILAKARGPAFWLSSVAFGAVFPTLVAAFVIMPMRGQLPPPGNPMTALMIGFLVNGIWGLGTAGLYRLFSGERR